MKHSSPQITDLTVSSFHLSTNGLRPLGTPSFEEWVACGLFLRNAEQSVQFWIGDWLLYGEHAFGKTEYETAIAHTGLSYQTLRIYKYVASSLPVSVRRNTLSFHHHKEVANLPPLTQAYFLTQAEANGWSLVKLRQEKNRWNLETARPAGTHTAPGLLLGNAKDHLARLPDESLDMVLTAPTTNTTPLPHIETVLGLLAHKLKPNSHLYLFTSWQTYPLLFPLLQTHFTVKNLLVWNRGRPCANGENTPYQQVYECVLFAHKGRRHLSGRRDASILEFPVAEADALAHEAEKPLPLLKYLIEKSSLPNEVVCDPFMGTGAVCLAAKQTGRRYIGIEQDQHCYATASTRLAGSDGEVRTTKRRRDKSR